MTISSKFCSYWANGLRHFELLPIFTDYANKKKGGMKFKKKFFSETTEPLSTKLC
jgi:hypothetical protein